MKNIFSYLILFFFLLTTLSHLTASLSLVENTKSIDPNYTIFTHTQSGMQTFSLELEKTTHGQPMTSGEEAFGYLLQTNKDGRSYINHVTITQKKLEEKIKKVQPTLETLEQILESAENTITNYRTTYLTTIKLIGVAGKQYDLKKNINYLKRAERSTYPPNPLLVEFLKSKIAEIEKETATKGTTL